MFSLIRKDTGEGIVCAVDEGQIVVAPLSLDDLVSTPTKKGCGKAGCGNCGGCFALISVPNGYAGRFRIPTDKPKHFKPGDRVSFIRFIPEPNIMSALVFGVPIGFALTVMLCWLLIAPQSVESAVAAWSIAAAFFSGIVILGILDRIFKAKYPTSIINGNKEPQP